MPTISECSAFGKLAKENWKSIAGGSVVFLLIGWALCLGVNIPKGFIFIGVFFVATAWASFLAWLQEYRKNKNENLFDIETKIIDLVYDSSLASLDTRYDFLGALIHYSVEIKTEADTEIICARLEELNHGDPFAALRAHYGSNAFKGLRLRFLRDARQVGRHNLKTNLNINSYVRLEWADKNNLNFQNDNEIAPDSEEGQLLASYYMKTTELAEIRRQITLSRGKTN